MLTLTALANWCTQKLFNRCHMVYNGVYDEAPNEHLLEQRAVSEQSDQKVKVVNIQAKRGKVENRDGLNIPQISATIDRFLPVGNTGRSSGGTTTNTRRGNDSYDDRPGLSRMSAEVTQADIESLELDTRMKCDHAGGTVAAQADPEESSGR